MTKKITALFLSLLMLGCMVSAVAVDDPQIVPYASDYLDGCAITTTAETKNHRIVVDYTVYGTDDMVELGATKIQIQKYQFNEWVDYVTLEGSSTKNDMTHSDTVFFHGMAGVKYRAVVYAYAKDKTGSDSRAYDGTGVYCK